MMSKLPETPEALRGKRAAKWVRESSKGQRDKYGPAAQRTMIADAIARLGMLDTGLEWLILKSAWSGPDAEKDAPLIRTPEFVEILRAAEAGEFDVLLVGYAS